MITSNPREPVKPTDITNVRRPDCRKCVEGWICEAHPEKPWPYRGCAGPGKPCDAPDCVQERLDRQDRFGWLGAPAAQHQPHAALVRILWRMKWRRVVTAALYGHPGGTELRVYFEPESAGDLLHSLVERIRHRCARGEGGRVTTNPRGQRLDRRVDVRKSFCETEPASRHCMRAAQIARWKSSALPCLIHSQGLGFADSVTIARMCLRLQILKGVLAARGERLN
jgi:hypothetical protein